MGLWERQNLWRIGGSKELAVIQLGVVDACMWKGRVDMGDESMSAVVRIANTAL